jgi:hypothetical protein
MNPVPVFPSSRPLVIEDKGMFDDVFRRFPPTTSELTFTNLFAWRHAYGFGVSVLDDYLLVVSTRDSSERRIFDPLGPLARKFYLIEKCFALAGDRPCRFVRLPESTAALFIDRKDFSVKEDRDQFDYVYRSGDLIDLRGRDYDAKRNFIKRFRAEHVFRYEALGPARAGACLFFEEEWCLAKDCVHSEGLTREREALEEMLNHYAALGIQGGLIEVAGKIEAVTLGERLNPDTFVVHMEKANGALIGIYQTINQAFCASSAAGFAYINREQDLGVLGLRQAKESYHPYFMVKKYAVTKS